MNKRVQVFLCLSLFILFTAVGCMKINQPGYEMALPDPDDATPVSDIDGGFAYPDVYGGREKAAPPAKEPPREPAATSEPVADLGQTSRMYDDIESLKHRVDDLEERVAGNTKRLDKLEKVTDQLRFAIRESSTRAHESTKPANRYPIRVGSFPSGSALLDNTLKLQIDAILAICEDDGFKIVEIHGYRSKSSAAMSKFGTSKQLMLNYGLAEQSIMNTLDYLNGRYKDDIGVIKKYPRMEARQFGLTADNQCLVFVLEKCS